MTIADSLRKIECELDGMYFARYFMKMRMGTKMIVNAHHHEIQKALDKTISGEITRLIITVPPGYTKTELASISYMARGLALNHSAKFLHLSYSHSLALLNSASARLIMKSAEYQAMWELRTRDDTDSKSMWWTEQGGGVYATSSKGQVTGFRAGHMSHSPNNFTGALIIDDPVKPEDAYSDVMREGVNSLFNETISSRLAVENVPIILIMQRVHTRDLAGYLLSGGSGEKWHHLDLPVIVNNDEPYPSEYTHGIKLEHNLPNGWLWRFKHNETNELALKSHRRKFYAQYMQRPLKRDEDTALWTEALIRKARDLDVGNAIRTIIAVDPATTNTETSDEHGIIIASEHEGVERNTYSIIADYSRKGSTLEWAQAVIAAYNNYESDAVIIETNQGGDMCESVLRNAGFNGRVITVHAKKGKTLRAEPVVGLYEMGLVRHSAGLHLLEEEMLDFDPVTQKSNGKSPNRIDACVYALTELSGDSSTDALKLAIG
jgi:phage terminase large subunit-like protein